MAKLDQDSFFNTTDVVMNEDAKAKNKRQRPVNEVT
jgi:hypothetical protein